MSYTAYDLFDDMFADFLGSNADDLDLDRFKSLVTEKSQRDVSRMPELINTLIHAYAEGREVSYVKAVEDLLSADTFEEGGSIFIARKSYANGTEVVGYLPPDWRLIVDPPEEV